MYLQEVVNPTADMTRNTVQKSVCVLSKLVCTLGRRHAHTHTKLFYQKYSGFIEVNQLFIKGFKLSFCRPGSPPDTQTKVPKLMS